MKGLDFFSDPDNGLYCSKVCREGGGHPRCYIRMCAEERGVSICFECLTSPCEKFEYELTIGDVVERLVKEAEEFKRLGMDGWLRKWEELSKEVES